jgi:hypothetical protein
MNPELLHLEDRLQRQQWSKWLCYQRHSLGIADDEQKIAIAREVLAMPHFGVFQCMAEHHWDKLRNPTKTELEILVEQLQEEPVKLLCYRRRSLGAKSEQERIEVAKQVIAMPPFSRAREKFETLWAKRNAAGEPGAT